MNGYEKFNEGVKKGIQQGIDQGIKQGALQTARTMLENNFDVKLIMKITGLSAAEIAHLTTQSYPLENHDDFLS